MGFGREGHPGCRGRCSWLAIACDCCCCCCCCCLWNLVIRGWRLGWWANGHDDVRLWGARTWPSPCRPCLLQLWPVEFHSEGNVRIRSYLTLLLKCEQRGLRPYSVRDTADCALTLYSSPSQRLPPPGHSQASEHRIESRDSHRTLGTLGRLGEAREGGLAVGCHGTPLVACSHSFDEPQYTLHVVVRTTKRDGNQSS
jgi:hypothetical protein